MFFIVNSRGELYIVVRLQCLDPNQRYKRSKVYIDSLGLMYKADFSTESAKYCVRHFYLANMHF